MKRAFKYISPLILLAVSLTGCQKLNGGESDANDISFTVRFAEQTKAAGQYTENDLNSIGQFKVTGYDNTLETKVIDKQEVVQKDDVWKLKDNPKMWFSGHTMTFWAEANLPEWASTSVSTSYIDLSVSEIPSSAADQWDPLIGYYKGTGTDGQAEITFYHPMTSVTFKTGFHGNPEYITGINSVTLTGVFQKGTASVSYTDAPVISWTPVGTKTVSVDFNDGKSESKMPFILIPQNLSTNDVSLTINVNLKSGGSSNIAVSLPKDNWKAGYFYTYTLDYAIAIESEFIVTLTDWGYVQSTNHSHPNYFDADFDGIES
ncbi:MAG: fimbrillin family protein [Bacteroidales bacterium]|nr:fimbrillin family protein [Bacteroidales bacterium]